jgi:NLI interacting factor-like phosphatase
MQVLPDKGTVYFDVDGTLVHLVYGVEDGTPLDEGEVIMEHYGKVKLIPRRNTIEQLKIQKSLGYHIVVWSHSSEWAETVVKALKLEKYVDYVMNKPIVYYDDQTPEYILCLKGSSED